MQQLERRLLTLRDAARFLGVSEATVWNWRRAGKIARVRHNGRGRWLYDERDLVALKANPPGPNSDGPGGRRGKVVKLPLKGDQLPLELRAGDSAYGVVDGQGRVRAGLRLLVHRAPADENPDFQTARLKAA